MGRVIEPRKSSFSGPSPSSRGGQNRPGVLAFQGGTGGVVEQGANKLGTPGNSGESDCSSLEVACDEGNLSREQMLSDVRALHSSYEQGEADQPRALGARGVSIYRP